MDKVIEGTKFFNELLVEKGKMTRDDFAGLIFTMPKCY